MREVLAIAAGGALGAVARYLISSAAGRWLESPFPWGTLTVNVLGCFLLGAVAEYVMLQGDPAPLVVRGLTIGFLGAMTTFSTFGLETYRPLAGGKEGLALANIAANLLLGLTAVWLGVLLTRQLRP